VYKIITFKQQRLALILGERISEAIAKIQPSRIAAALAEIPVGFTGDLRLLLGDGLDDDACLGNGFIEPAAGDRVPADASKSSRQAILAVQQFAVIDRPEGLLQMSCAIFADGQQAVRQAISSLPAQTVEALAKSLGNGCGHAFPGQRGKLLREPVRLAIFDIQAHS
jgi:hypothetical protein